jgi:toxin secretion/phage lysis holin
MSKIIQTIAAIASGLCSFMFGGMDGLLYALVSFMVLDYITGCLVAIIKKELSSKVGFKGIAKKVLIMALVAVGHILDTHILGGGAFCRSAVIGFYIANEGISILENAGDLGIPLPKKLIAVLKQLKSKDDEESEDDNHDSDS